MERVGLPKGLGLALVLCLAPITALAATVVSQPTDSATSAVENRSLHQLRGTTMGNQYQVQWRQGELSAQRMFALRAQIESRLAEVNASMSTWDPDSELSQFNHQATTQPVAVSTDLNRVLGQALALGEITGGALDVTIGPLLSLWGFGAEAGPRQVPSEQALAAVRQQVGLSHLNLDQGQLSKDHPQTQVDLSAIAKGFGVDAIAELLEQQGIQDYLVDIGGELRVAGQRDSGAPWRIGVDKPYAIANGQVQVINLDRGAVATSGDYRNYFERDGQRFAHILDPHTGRPVQRNVVSATVLAPDCMTADGLATAFMVMGVKPALLLAEQRDIPLMLLEDRHGKIVTHYSSAFKPYLEPG